MSCVLVCFIVDFDNHNNVNLYKQKFPTSLFETCYCICLAASPVKFLKAISPTDTAVSFCGCLKASSYAIWINSCVDEIQIKIGSVIQPYWLLSDIKIWYILDRGNDGMEPGWHWGLSGWAKCKASYAKQHVTCLLSALARWRWHQLPHHFR